MMDRDTAAEADDDLAESLFVSRTPLMREVARLVRVAMAHPVPVLLCGPSGSGKERVAGAIHAGGARREHPFIAVNCGALSETLLEAELFGHRQGAFTGALAERPGLFAVADGGTIFLDEIGEAPPALQIKLLRTLDSGEVVALGATAPRCVDVRVIAASNRDLEAAMRGGRFRSDLYYRINTLPIHLPPLAQRAEDIAPLARQLLTEIGKRLHKHTAGFSTAALACLQRYRWPGNVRELHNEIERAVALAQPGEVIELDLLSAKLRETRPHPSPTSPATTLRHARRAFEAQYIQEVLAQQHGNAAAAAKSLGISRSMLQRKIRTYCLRDKWSGP